MDVRTLASQEGALRSLTFYTVFIGIAKEGF